MDDTNHVIYVDAETWNWLTEELEKPPRVLPKLQALLESVKENMK
jgi:uncharacterized protein (DUF1778 family)